MRTAPPTVFVVDDDPAVRQSLRWLIESVGLAVETYESGIEFLERCKADTPGCLVVDVRMPGLSGLDLQDRLAERHVSTPIIIITGHAELPTAIRALKRGAWDFIEKPFNDDQLLERIHQAIERDVQIRRHNTERSEICARLDSLSQREREVLEMVVAGRANKVIADDLGLSTKTIEVHRANVMKKMQAESLADLVRMTLLQSKS